MDASFQKMFREITNKTLLFAERNEISLSSIVNDENSIYFLENSVLTSTTSEADRFDSIKINGHNINCDYYYRKPSGAFNPIKDGNGLVIGDHTENIISCLFELRFIALEKREEVILYFLKKSGVLNDVQIRKIMDRPRPSIIGYAVDIANEFRQKRKKEIEPNIRSAKNSITELNDMLKSSIKELKRLDDEKKSLTEIKKIDSSYFHNQLKEISKLPFIESVRTSKNSLTFSFKETKLKGFNIGKYALTVGYNEDDNRLKLTAKSMELKDFRIVGMSERPNQHPHIDKKGNICFGSIQGEINNSIQRGDLYSIVNGFLELLQTYNRHNPYIKITYFKNVLTKAREIIKKKEKLKLPHQIETGEDSNLHECEECGIEFSDDDFCFDCMRCNDHCICEEEEEEE